MKSSSLSDKLDFLGEVQPSAAECPTAGRRIEPKRVPIPRFQSANHSLVFRANIVNRADGGDARRERSDDPPHDQGRRTESAQSAPKKLALGGELRFRAEEGRGHSQVQRSREEARERGAGRRQQMTKFAYIFPAISTVKAYPEPKPRVPKPGKPQNCRFKASERGPMRVANRKNRVYCSRPLSVRLRGALASGREGKVGFWGDAGPGGQKLPSSDIEPRGS